MTRSRRAFLLLCLLTSGGCNVLVRGGGWSEPRARYNAAPLELIDAWIAEVSAFEAHGTSSSFPAERQALAMRAGEELHRARLDAGLRIYEKYSSGSIHPLFQGSSWDEVLGHLYAARALCIVQHQPMDAFTLCFCRGMGDLAAQPSKVAADAQGIPMLLGFLILCPLDAVLVPIQVGYLLKENASVPEAAIEEGRQSMRLARAHGFVGEYERPGSLFSKHYYVDCLDR